MKKKNGVKKKWVQFLSVERVCIVIVAGCELNRAVGIYVVYIM